MEVSYRKDASRSYMIIKKADQERVGFREKMILRNSVSGMLKLSMQYMNGEAYYSYDIRDCQSLSDFFSDHTISLKELLGLLSGLRSVLEQVDRYLLSAHDLLLSEQNVFWNPDECQPLFCYLPDNAENFEQMSMAFAQFIIDHIDQSDQRASDLAYNYFDQVCGGLINPDSLMGEEAGNFADRSEPSYTGGRYGIRADKYGGSTSRDRYDRSGKYNRSERYDGSASYDRSERYDSFGSFKDEAVLSEDKIWKDEPREGYYFNSRKSDEKESAAFSPLLKAALVVCSTLTASAAALYTAILLNPSVISTFGFEDVSYAAIGAPLALIFAAAILLFIHILKNRASSVDDGAVFEDMQPQNIYCPDPMELQMEEFSEARDLRSDRESRDEADEPADDGETVLLSNAGRGSAVGRAALMGTLNGRRQKFEIYKSPYIIGKLAEKADGAIPDSRVSRIHACIREDSGRYYISDLNSTNGTCLNERRLEQNETAELVDGDIVKFANITMTFRCG